MAYGEMAVAIVACGMRLGKAVPTVDKKVLKRWFPGWNGVVPAGIDYVVMQWWRN